MPVTVETTELIPVETRKKLEEALEFFNSLKEVKFTTQEEYDRGVELCKTIKTHIKEIEADRRSLVNPFNDKVKTINTECKGVTSKLENGERVLKNGMNRFFQEQEQKRIEQQKKLEAEAEARRRAEEERARKEAQKAEAYRDQGRDKMADKANARAETSQTIANTIVAPVVENKAHTQGVSYKTVYKISIEDEDKAVLACVGNPVLRNYVSLDIKGLQRLAQAQKGRFVCDGIRVIEDKQVTVRSR